MSYYERTEIAAEIAENFKRIQQPQPIQPPAAEPGFVKPGGWGAKKNPSLWQVTEMKDDPELWKVVDNENKNVATNFVTKEGAQKFIDMSKSLYDEEGDLDEPEKPEQPPVGETTVIGPYPATGQELKSTQRGPAVAHYQSGKPDDKTIERNVKNIKARNHQFITYVTMKSIEHDDIIQLKLGGTHMGTGWFDNGVSYTEGKCGLGTEKKHPSTKTGIIKGPKIGSVLNKKVGVCCTYFADQNKIELWTDTGSGWEKKLEGVNIDGFNPKADTFEAQLRIDGFEGGVEPVIHTAVVQPI